MKSVKIPRKKTEAEKLAVTLYNKNVFATSEVNELCKELKRLEHENNELRKLCQHYFEHFHSVPAIE